MNCYLVMVCLVLEMTAPAAATAKFAPGDRLVVVNKDTEVCRYQQVVERLPKGTVVIVKAVEDKNGELWIKIDRPAKEGYGWVYEENLARHGLVRVNLDKLRVEVRRKEDPPIRLPPGTSRLVEETETVRHSIEISKRWKIEGGVRVQAQAGAIFPYGPAVVHTFGKIEAELRGEIEQTTGQHVGLESKRTRSVTIHGGTAKPIKVVWVDYYRSGTTTILVAGEEHEVPFEYCEDFGLKAEDAEAGWDGSSPLLWGTLGFAFGVTLTLAVTFAVAVCRRRRTKRPGLESTTTLAEQGAAADRPREHGASSHNVKPA
jgi:hypothetical protein